jgi:lysophospholipase L1-like esterase
MTKKVFLTILLIFGVAIIVISPSKNGIKRLYYKLVMFTKPTKIVLDLNKKRQIIKENPITKENIIFLGDSLINSANWHILFNNPNVKNLGVNGLSLTGLVESNLFALLKSNNKIFILIGINDFWPRIELSEIKNKLLDLEAVLIQNKFSDILFIEILPFNHSYLSSRRDEIKEYNQLLKSICKKNGYKYIQLRDALVKPGTSNLADEFTYDGIHLNELGYQKMANELLPYLD